MAGFDRSSKWLIEHYGYALLRLAGVVGVVSWRALQPEVVQPGQLPDGLIEAQLAGETEPRLFILEIATYPERRLEEQLLRDMLLVFLNRRVLPEVVALVLYPKGQFRAASRVEISSPSGRSGLTTRWQIVELWDVPAEPLLASGDPGLMPWVPLARHEGEPEPVLRRCREVIEREDDAEERSTLLAVTQVLASLRYNDPRLLTIFGGPGRMIDTPLLRELREEWTAEALVQGRAEGEAEAVVSALEIRFGQVPADIEKAVRSTRDTARLKSLIAEAIRCASLESFRSALFD